MYPFTEDLTRRQKNVSKGRNTCEYIVLHHTGVVGEGNIPTLLGERNSKVSCHFLIMRDGRTYKLADPLWITWHAGESQWDGRTNLNRYALGIEVEGPGFTQAQREKAKELTEYLMYTFKIPKNKVIRHRDISAGRKIDPDDSLFRMKGGLVNWKIWQFLLSPKDLKS